MLKLYCLVIINNFGEPEIVGCSSVREDLNSLAKPFIENGNRKIYRPILQELEIENVVAL